MQLNWELLLVEIFERIFGIGSMGFKSDSGSSRRNRVKKSVKSKRSNKKFNKNPIFASNYKRVNSLTGEKLKILEFAHHFFHDIVNIRLEFVNYYGKVHISIPILCRKEENACEARKEGKKWISVH